jgi:ABC-2 type transport system ATP-binding protein
VGDVDQLSDDAKQPSVDSPSRLSADAVTTAFSAGFSPATGRAGRTEALMITVSGLTKQYGGRTVVDDVSFTLEPGTVTGFLGPNGAGKTTTMRMITGLVPATRGSALVDGRPYAALPNPGAVMGTLLDAGAVHPGRTGRTHLRLLADTIGVPASRVDEVLELVDLTSAAGRRIRGYSLGMRQRLGIAGALLADPRVLMFDEPANGLDPEGIRWMRSLLRVHADRGGTVLLSSHLLHEVESTVDRLLVIGNGRIVADGSVASLLGSDGTTVRAFDTAALARDLEAKGYAVSPGPDGALVVADASPSDVGAVAAAGGHVLSELRVQQRGLEDVFFSLTAA